MASSWLFFFSTIKNLDSSACFSSNRRSYCCFVKHTRFSLRSLSIIRQNSTESMLQICRKLIYFIIYYKLI